MRRPDDREATGCLGCLAVIAFSVAANVAALMAVLAIARCVWSMATGGA